MRRLFWMLLGAGLMYWAVSKGRSVLRRVTPRGIAEQVEQQGNRAAAGLGDFYATFKTSMAAREAELRDELNLPERAS